MKKPTYAEQWQKLTEAYVNDRVNAYEPCCCFVGNLLNGTDGWEACRKSSDGWGMEVYRHPFVSLTLFDDTTSMYVDGRESIELHSNGLYKPIDIIQLEQLFLRTYNTTKNEESLFKAFCVTLDLLKQIHISKGEVIDETPVFTKRILVAQ